MSWLTNELIFYFGVGITAVSLLLGILYFCISKINYMKLNAQLDTEYGKDDRHNTLRKSKKKN